MLCDLLYALPRTAQLALLALLCICACGLLLASTCRVNHLNSKAHKFSWIACYIAYAAFAAALLIQLASGDRVTDAHLAALIGLSLNIWLTHKSWAQRVPRIMDKS